MIPVMSLWLPIVLSAVAVFLVSSIIQMATPFHRGDLHKLPQEDEAMAALRQQNIPPGDYAMPYGGSMAAMKDPAFQAKMQAGPVAFMTVVPNGPPAMGTSLILWFVYSLVVSAMAAYITGHAVPAGASSHAVIRFSGCTAFTGYALALLQNSIWFKRNWGATIRYMIDGLFYAAATAAVFAWLWPH